MNGFENENQIIDLLNQKDLQFLSKDLQNVIIKINKGKKPNNISATKYGGNNKADLSINLDGKKYLISVKKGSGNSVHEEFVEKFILYLNKNIEVNFSVFNDLRHFIWCDNTLDGTGEFKDRMDLKIYKKKFPEKILNIQNYFDKHKIKLINRFLISGSEKSTTDIDYLFYGNVNNCKVISAKDFLNSAITIKKNPISISYLTFQVYNRRLTYIANQEYRRGKIQLKWGTLQKDIDKLYE